MKEAMWGVGLIFLGMFGFFLINTFGNITVVNQQDFTAMTNTVEAAMNDALDYAHYRSGFCVCSNTGGWDFTSSSQYTIEEPDFSNGSGCNQEKNCKLVEGEFKIDKDLFISSLNSRFARAVRGKDDYKISVTDIIEYPPKVSVVVTTNFNEKEVEIKGESYASKDGFIYGGTSTIVNNINAIMESYSTYVAPPEPVLPTPKPTAPPVVTPNPTTAPAPVVTPAPAAPAAPSRNTPTPKPNRPRKTATPKPNSCSCFLAGTKIMVAGGYKNIEKINSGDYVLTYNEKKKINELKKVVQLFVFEGSNEELYTIQSDDTEFSLTGHHRVYTKRDGKYQYIAAKDLKIGDIMLYSDGNYHEIKNISSVDIHQTVYNLETEDNHNFYIGEKGILVHNMSIIKNLHSFYTGYDGVLVQRLALEDRGAHAGGRDSSCK